MCLWGEIGTASIVGKGQDVQRNNSPLRKFYECMCTHVRCIYSVLKVQMQLKWAGEERLGLVRAIVDQSEADVWLQRNSFH